uniref:Carnosine N-methyltransferase n=1 Tax=Panagrolaimus sp. JU765 TaxID=591449 RepID=A0AC34R872_9BILA
MNLREKNAVLSFTPEDQKLINLDQMLERHKEIIVAAQSNQALLEHSIQFAMRSLGKKNPYLQGIKLWKKGEVAEERMGRVRSLIKQMVRDWSSEGAEERATCYDRVIRAVEERFPDHEKRHDVHILVPGVGLARLAWEYMNRGFSVVANEHDLSMIAVANFMLNSKLKINEISIFPFITERLNCWSFKDRMREI